MLGANIPGRGPLKFGAISSISSTCLVAMQLSTWVMSTVKQTCQDHCIDPEKNRSGKLSLFENLRTMFCTQVDDGEHGTPNALEDDEDDSWIEHGKVW